MSRVLPSSTKCLVFAVFGMWELAFASADDAVPSPPPLVGEIAVDPDATQDLVLMLNPPVFVRMQVEVDGIPFRRHRREHIASLHAAVDLNADGMLAPDEIAAGLASDGVSVEVRRILQDATLWNFDLLPVDRQLSAEEMALAIESRLGGPFQEPASTTTNAPMDVSFAVMGNSGRTPGEVLFETLDSDENGRLTSDEVEVGRQSLRRLDFDVDGNASLSEMEYTRNPFQGQTQFGATSEGVPVQVIDRTQGLSSLIDQFLRSYGDEPRVARGDRTISAGSLGLPGHVFERHDRDGNGTLDRREVRALLENPPAAIALTVRIGRRDEGVPMVEVHSSAEWSDATVRTSPAGIASLMVDRFQIEIHAGQSTPSQFVEFFKSLFNAYDRDANAYLERSEVEGGQLAGVFEKFDINHDGMLYEEEMLAVVEAESTSAFSRTRLVPSNRGRDFFEILDENRDRRISPRELDAIVARIGIWDENDDDAISQSEVPQLYQLTFDRGQPDFPGVMPQGVVAVMPSPGSPAP